MHVLDLYQEAMALFAALEEEGVAYALCGALALAVHGAPRATTDIDLLAEAPSVPRIIAIAKRLGFVFGAAPMGFRDGITVHRWSKIVEGEVLTLDVLELAPGYEPIWRGRIRASLGAHDLSVVSREGLIQMKLWAARPQDIADVERLREADR